MNATEPLRRTPLWPYHSQRGATFTEHSGWQIADRFTSVEREVRAAREGVALADMSWLAKFDVKGTRPDFGCESVAPGTFWSLARGHGLVTCETDDAARVSETLAKLAVAQSEGDSNRCCHVTDVTSVYAALLLVGPQSREVLHRLTDLDVADQVLPVGACAPTHLAETYAIVLRTDVGGSLGFFLLVGWEYGEYVWDALAEAGENLEMKPIGFETLRKLLSAPS